MKMHARHASLFVLAVIIFLPLTELKAQNYQCWPVTQVSCGLHHTLLTKSDGSLWGMGNNTYGQLGLGTNIAATTIPQLIMTNGVGNIYCGPYQSLFWSGGALWGIGDNDECELGDGSTNDHYIPQQIYKSPNRFFSVGPIAAGWDHTVFTVANYSARVSGSLMANGWNFYGQLGDGTTIIKTKPEVIFSTNLLAVTALAAGLGHTLFIRPDGSLWGMGANFDGQLGTGNYNNTNVPVMIVSRGVAAIAANNYQSFFIELDGSLWAMGANGTGQLGIGSVPQTNLPTRVPTSGSVVAIAAGVYHTLFIKSDGSLWGMGDNGYDELGLGTIYSTNIPVMIVASNVVAAAAGQYHSLFIKSDGSLWGMGDNSSGQLGLTNLSYSITPVEIVAPPPYINIAQTRSSFTFSWGTNYPTFTLQTIASLSSTNWSNVTTAPVIIGGNYVVTNSPAGTRGFYRLKQ